MKDWQAFEEAVAAFAQALSPDAVVKHDAHLPDIHTGRLRQRDVWIETAFAGHFRISILVSCKRKKAKLSQQDIDAFAGELASSGAHKGVLYAHSGFSKPALEKAEKLGVSCCVLLDNQPAPIPDILSFSSFCFNELFQLKLQGNLRPNGLSTAAELLQMSDGTGRRPVDALVHGYRKTSADQKITGQALADLPVMSIGVDISHPELGLPIRLTLVTSWQGYEARMDAFLVSGSYSFTDKDFKGSFATPAVDTRSINPGPGWVPIDPEAPPVIRAIAASFIRRPLVDVDFLIGSFGSLSFERDFQLESASRTPT